MFLLNQCDLFLFWSIGFLTHSSTVHVATYFSSLCSPPKKYKIVPHTRPLRSPSVGPNVLGVVQLNGHPRAPRHPRPRPRHPPTLPKPHFEDNYDDELPYVSPLEDADYNGMSQIVSILETTTTLSS